MKTTKKVVIVGGGFAGIQLAKNLDQKLFDVLLIDKINHHQFQPLFYQVATSQLEPSSISFPLRNIFKKQKNVQVRLAEAIEVDSAKSVLHTSVGPFHFDYLVLALGCKTNFFGNTEIAQHAYTLKSTGEAIALRNHILQNFEDALNANELEKNPLLNISIVGAGPTGVELAGSFAEIKTHVLPKDYQGIDFSKLRITLIEGSSNTLNAMSDKARKASKQYLQDLGVEVITDCIVTSYDGLNLKLNNGTLIQTHTLIWAAGVTANTIKGLEAEYYTPNNRIKVNRFNQLSNHTTIFVVGDLALMETPNYPKGHPQVANVAINQAKLIAKNLKSIAQEQPLQVFEYKDLGSMATIGTNKAVVDLPHFKFKGYFAWLTWMFLHLMLILSVRNKLIIFINWAWAYVSRDTSLRLILRPQVPPAEEGQNSK